MGRSKKQQIDVTSDRAKFGCPLEVRELIRVVNKIDQTLDKDWKDLDYSNPWDAHANQEFCKIIHQMAQLARVPADMREDYARALGGSQEEWDRFCERLGVPLWRKWSNESDREWRWPLGTYELTINSNGKIEPRYHNNLLALAGVEATRIRECRHCQEIFWASRNDMVACGKRCANNLRAKTFREKKKLEAKASKKRKKP
jgi:hypothetical protein